MAPISTPAALMAATSCTVSPAPSAPSALTAALGCSAQPARRTRRRKSNRASNVPVSPWPPVRRHWERPYIFVDHAYVLAVVAVAVLFAIAAACGFIICVIGFAVWYMYSAQV